MSSPGTVTVSFLPPASAGGTWWERVVSRLQPDLPARIYPMAEAGSEVWLKPADHATGLLMTTS